MVGFFCGFVNCGEFFIVCVVDWVIFLFGIKCVLSWVIFCLDDVEGWFVGGMLIVWVCICI